jgi:hypothetical protein
MTSPPCQRYISVTNFHTRHHAPHDEELEVMTVMPTGREVMIITAIREERGREAERERLIMLLPQPAGLFEDLLRKFGTGVGRILESAGEWIQEKAGEGHRTNTGNLTTRGANYG